MYTVWRAGPTDYSCCIDLPPVQAAATLYCVLQHVHNEVSDLGAPLIQKCCTNDTNNIQRLIH